MDYVKNFTSSNGNQYQNQERSQSEEQGQNRQDHNQEREHSGFLGDLSDKLNSAARGGRESEKNEDMLNKGIDAVQEYVLGQGKQDDESAIEQAKDEQISDFLRGRYKGVMGKELPIEDKETRLG